MRNKHVQFLFFLAAVIAGYFFMARAGFFPKGEDEGEAIASRLLANAASELDLGKFLQSGFGQKEIVSAESIKVPILIYHSVRPHFGGETEIQKAYSATPEAFDAELSYLEKNGYRVISLADLVNQISDKGFFLPPKSVALTFDDGWANQYKYAFPILKKHKMSAAFFIFTDAIGKKNFLTWDQVKEIRDAGMTIGVHTKSHPYLATIADERILKDEIIGSKKIIEEKLGEPAYFFAYPFGHYTQQIIDILKSAGFKAARTTYVGTHHSSADLYSLTGIQVNSDIDDMIAKLAK